MRLRMEAARERSIGGVSEGVSEGVREGWRQMGEKLSEEEAEDMIAFADGSSKGEINWRGE